MHLHNLTNRQILSKLDESVYGHQEAKKILINLVYRSKLRYYQKYGLMMKDNLIKNTHCLLIGDSGTGKTYLVEQLQKICKFPLVTFDATQIIPTSAKGSLDLDTIIKTIKDQAEIKAKEMDFHTPEGVLEQTVVFIDEVDKLAKSYDTSGNWNRQIQSTLLRFIENKTELRGLSFIFAGAFSDMQKENKPSSLGFHSQFANNEHHPIQDYNEAVIRYGLIPELVGRITNIIHLDGLKLENYMSILCDLVIPSKIADLNQYGVPFMPLCPDILETICKKAMKSGQGIRMLYKEMDLLTLDLEFHCEEYQTNEKDIKGELIC